ncbi:MAG TPA: pilin [Candidatus Paceibacterota bacterium]
MKKILLLLFVAMLAISPLTTFAQASATNGSSDAVNLCSGDGGFVSLSCIPGFAQAAGTNGLANFFNLLYDLCIGAAAVIAVLQITRAGIMYMGSDSFTEKKDAKHLIAVSLMGMVLVLSPALILGIINPKINTLNLDTSGLTVSSANSTNAGAGNNNSSGTGSGGACTGTDGTQGSCPSDQICHVPNGQTQGTCSGTAVGNNTEGGTSIFDGGYMDLEKYPSDTAAQAGTCSNSSQTKTVFGCTQQDSNGKCVEDYAACITPSLSYTAIIIDPPGLLNSTEKPISSDETKYNTYSGECIRLQSELTAIRQQRTTFSNTVNPDDVLNGDTVTCPDGAAPATTEPNTDISCVKTEYKCVLQ